MPEGRFVHNSSCAADGDISAEVVHNISLPSSNTRVVFAYTHCYYSKSLTHNGNRTTCTLIKNIIAKLRELNGVVEDDTIFL